MKEVSYFPLSFLFLPLFSSSLSGRSEPFRHSNFILARGIVFGAEMELLLTATTDKRWNTATFCPPISSSFPDFGEERWQKFSLAC